MANVVLDKGFQVQAASAQFKVQKHGTLKQTCTQATTDEQPIGVLQEDVSATDVTNEKVANVRMIGISTCIADGAIAVGDVVGAGATGKVTKTSLATGNPLVGIALTASAADNDQIQVFLTIGARF